MEEGLHIFAKFMGALGADLLLIWLRTKIIVKEIKKGLFPEIKESEQWKREKGENNRT